MVALLSEVTATKMESELMTVGGEPSCVVHGHSFTRLPGWCAPRIARCEALRDVAEVGAPSISTFAPDVYGLQTGSSAVETCAPSESWCYWFMSNKLGLDKRRIAGSRTLPVQVKTQQRPYLYNLQHLVILLHECQTSSTSLVLMSLAAISFLMTAGSGRRLAPVTSPHLSRRTNGSTPVISRTMLQVASSGVHQIFAGKTAKMESSPVCVRAMLD